MKITESFRSFAPSEHPPQNELQPSEPESNFTAHLPPPLSREAILALKDGELLHPPANAHDTRFILDDSITHWADPYASPEQKGAIQEIVQHDAEVLASQLLPPDQVHALNLDTDPQSTNEHPPMLSEVILLARAYDVTADPKIKDAIALIFETTPPQASDELQQAFEAAPQHGIMQQYRRILSDKERQAVQPPTPEERRFITMMRRASVQREDLPASTGSVEGTGIQS
jgi:hypothetical protein